MNHSHFSLVSIALNRPTKSIWTPYMSFLVRCQRFQRCLFSLRRPIQSSVLTHGNPKKWIKIRRKKTSFNEFELQMLQITFKFLSRTVHILSGRKTKKKKNETTHTNTLSTNLWAQIGFIMNKYQISFYTETSNKIFCCLYLWMRAKWHLSLEFSKSKIRSKREKKV